MKTFKHTSRITAIIRGNVTIGPRSKLNNANDTNALSAVSLFESDKRTYVENVVTATLKNIYKNQNFSLFLFLTRIGVNTQITYIIALRIAFFRRNSSSLSLI